MRWRDLRAGDLVHDASDGGPNVFLVLRELTGDRFGGSAIILHMSGRVSRTFLTLTEMSSRVTVVRHVASEKFS